MCVDSLEEAIEQLEANMQQLCELSELGPVVSTVSTQLSELKEIVHETLSASIHISAALAASTSQPEDAMYERLLEDLALMDEDELKAKENRLEQECASELARKQQVATIQDLDALLSMLATAKPK